jgi:hypothetical protein
MNRIAVLRFDLLGRLPSAFVNKTSGLLRRRQVTGNYFFETDGSFSSSPGKTAKRVFALDVPGIRVLASHKQR